MSFKLVYFKMRALAEAPQMLMICNGIERDSMRPALSARFQQLQNCLLENSSKFFIDNMPRAAEFAAFHHLDLSKQLDPMLIKEFPRLEAFTVAMTELPKMEEYLKDRPELIGVGESPQLVIDGIAHPTGLQQT